MLCAPGSSFAMNQRIFHVIFTFTNMTGDADESGLMLVQQLNAGDYLDAESMLLHCCFIFSHMQTLNFFAL
jgi:hypothetical protein